MIITQLFPRSINILTYIRTPIKNLIRQHTYMNSVKMFSTQKQRIAQLTSQQTLKQFSDLLYQNTTQSLQKGAELYATLQYKVEQKQKQLRQIQSSLESCPAHTKLLIQKIQIVGDNIKKSEEEIEAIQKRAQKQLVDCRNFAITSIAKEVLDVADSLGKCKKMSMELHQSQDHEVVQQIVKADKQIKAIFQLYGIKEFDPLGDSYDPNKQEAIATIPAPEQKLKNKVAYTVRTGYTIKGRLLRSAHVGIYS